MKKQIVALTGIISSLSIAFPAYATSVNPCPTGVGGGDTLCNLTSDQFGSIISTALTVIVTIAVLIAVFFLVWGGIKWITSGGDKAKVESARNTIIAGIIGLVFVFLAYFIISLVASIFGIDLANLTLPSLA